ncbi:MAG: HEAT repeat domain-containing protein [Candidatus Ozemobacteraceae bacterium]
MFATIPEAQGAKKPHKAVVKPSTAGHAKPPRPSPAPANRTQPEQEVRLQELRLQQLIAQANQALQKEDPDQAERTLREIVGIATSNPSISSIRQGIERLRKKVEAVRPDSFTAETMAALADAEKEEDLGRVRDLLTKLKENKTANRDQLLRLSALEHELADGQTKLQERFKEIDALAQKGDWTEVRRLLKRNPGLFSPESMQIDALELRMAADFELGKLTDAELNEALMSILRDKPKSFWAHLVRGKMALKAHRESDAEKSLMIASSIASSHPALKGPLSQMQAKTNRRTFYATFLLLSLALIGWLIPRLFGFFETLEWMMMEGMVRRFPRQALSRLEKRIGLFEDRDKRIHLFEMLTEAAVGVHNPLKVERYGEELYDLMPRNRTALEYLGKFYLSLPLWHPKQAEITAAYATMHPNDREVLKDISAYVRESNDLRPVFAPHLMRHLELTGDEELTSFLLNSYLEKPCSTLGREGLNLLDFIGRTVKDDRIFGKIWQGNISAGQLEKAHAIAKNRGFEGKNPVAASLLEALERETSGEEKAIIEQIRTTRGTNRVAHIRDLLNRGYFSEEQGTELLILLGSLADDKDPAYRYAAQKIRNHLRDVQKQSQSFRAAVGLTASSPEQTAVKKAAEEKVAEQSPEKIGEKLAPSFLPMPVGDASEAPTLPFFPAITDTMIQEPISISSEETSSAPAETPSNIFGEPTPPETVPDVALISPQPEESREAQVVKETQEPLPVGIMLMSLSESASADEIFALAKRSKPTDVPAWDRYLKRNPPDLTLGLVLKSIGIIHTLELTPILLKFLDHSNPRVRANVIESLEENGDISVIPRLIPLMKDPENRIRANAIKALHSMKVGQADSALSLMAADAQVRMRDSAIFVLKSIKLPWTAILLQKLLNDPESFIRIRSIEALAEQNLPGNYDLLRRHSEKPIPLEEQEAVMEALRKLMPKSPVVIADPDSVAPFPPVGPAAGT